MPCGPDAPLAHMDDVSRGFENALLKAGHLLDSLDALHHSRAAPRARQDACSRSCLGPLAISHPVQDAHKDGSTDDVAESRGRYV